MDTIPPPTTTEEPTVVVSAEQVPKVDEAKVDEAKGDEAKVVEPPIIPPTEAIPEPFWAKRNYIKRSFGFDFNGVKVQGNFFNLGNNQIDVDGWYGDKEFESSQHLINMNIIPQALIKELLEKIQKILK